MPQTTICGEVSEVKGKQIKGRQKKIDKVGKHQVQKCCFLLDSLNFKVWMENLQGYLIT